MIVGSDLGLKRGGRWLLRGVTLQVAAGEVVALLGPNGAGKTTLLRLLAGDETPDQGAVHLLGKPLHRWPARELARMRAVLSQSSSLEFGFTAFEVALMGRMPHVELKESPEDLAIVQAALEGAGVAHLADRVYTTLSGGERQRVQLARVMAQLGETAVGRGRVQAPSPRLLLLDEPTSNLDVAHQHAALALARSQAAQGAAVLAVLHDLNLAGQYANRLALLRDGQLVACGLPADVLTIENIWRVFEVNTVVVPHPTLPVPLVVTTGSGRATPHFCRKDAGMNSANETSQAAEEVVDLGTQAAGAPGQPNRELLAAWRDLRQAEPHLRQRDAANRLGVSEAELVASLLGGSPGDGAILLDGRWIEILSKLEACGPITALSRNDTAVLEDKGTYMNMSADGPLGQVVGPRIDLRLFLSRWRYGFAFIEALSEGARRSVQFFDDRGMAIHKVFLSKEANDAAWQALLAAHTTDFQAMAAPVAAPAPRPEKPDAEVDVAGLQAGWAALQDTHEFFGLLHRFGVSRTQALRLCPNWASPVAPLSHRSVFELCRDQELSLMVFVGNRGIIQIHTGVPRKLVQMNSWWNVMDKDWNLHLQETGIASTWVVRKPTRDGVVSSMELFDARGEIIALLFSKRLDGKPEESTWARSLAALASGTSIPSTAS